MVEVIEEFDAPGGVPGRRRAPLAGRRRAALALPAGADPGAQDGPRDDLLAGALRVHPHQPDPDPPRPLRLRQVRQARRRLQRRLAGRGDPQDPPHLGPAQHRPLRRRQPRPGDRQLGDLRRPRLPGRRRSSTSTRRWSAPRSASCGCATSATCEAVVAEEEIVVGVLAVPADAAQEVADRLVKAGVKIIFNYSEQLLQVPPEVTVHTSSPAVDLLYALYFYLA